MPELIELTLRATMPDESTAVKVAEMLARAALGISAEEGVQVATEVARFEMSCHHDHDEVGQ
jgi:hypothetical protein